MARHVDENGLFIENTGYFLNVGLNRSRYTTPLEVAFVLCTQEQLKQLSRKDVLPSS